MQNMTEKVLEARQAFGAFVAVKWRDAPLSRDALSALLGPQRCAQVMAFMESGVVLPLEIVHDLALALKVAPAFLLEKYLAAYQPEVAQAILRSCGGLTAPDLAQVLDQILPELPSDQEYVLWNLKDMRAAALVMVSPKLERDAI